MKIETYNKVFLFIAKPPDIEFEGIPIYLCIEQRTKHLFPNLGQVLVVVNFPLYNHISSGSSPSTNQ